MRVVDVLRCGYCGATMTIEEVSDNTLVGPRCQRWVCWRCRQPADLPLSDAAGAVPGEEVKP